MTKTTPSSKAFQNGASLPSEEVLFDSYRGFIASHSKTVDQKEIDDILNICSVRHLNKGDFFKHHMDLCEEIGYLAEGSVRVYIHKDNGDAVTGRIIQRRNMITDFIGYRTRERTPICIEALYPCSLLVSPVHDVAKLLETNLTFNKVIREYTADSVVELGRLHMLFLSGTAKERYQFIQEHHPQLLKRFPLRFIASMIGITPTQLSRIRNKR